MNSLHMCAVFDHEPEWKRDKWCNKWMKSEVNKLCVCVSFRADKCFLFLLCLFASKANKVNLYNKLNFSYVIWAHLKRLNFYCSKCPIKKNKQTDEWNFNCEWDESWQNKNKTQTKMKTKLVIFNSKKKSKTHNERSKKQTTFLDTMFTLDLSAAIGTNCESLNLFNSRIVSLLEFLELFYLNHHRC